MMVRGIVFDMDGVLVDSEAFYQERRDGYLRLRGLEPQSGVSFVGSNERAIWEALVPDDEVVREQLKTEYRSYRRRCPVPYDKLLDPHVHTVFHILKEKGLLLAIASSSDRGSIAAMMRAAKITEIVDYYISGEDCREHKPAPEIYLRALAALGISAGEALAVEDSPVGIEAAKAAGLKVYALRPASGVCLDQSAADHIIDQLPDLLRRIDEGGLKAHWQHKV